MKKRLLAVMTCLTMLAVLFTGCKKRTGNDGAEDSSSEGSAVEATAVVSAGDEKGTHLECWSFVELHNTFYAEMVEKWNQENPDRTIYVTFTTYPYSDMHTKLLTSLNAGTGAPDICDVEIGQFPQVVNGLDTWLYPLNDALAPYKDSLVQARLQIYAGSDGNYYGAPTHVGATVMYYNTEILTKYGIDYTQIKTWDDYTKAGEELWEASGNKVHMTSVDTGGTDWLWLAMAEYGEDWTGAGVEKANVELESVSNMLTMQTEWLKSGVAMVSPDGHVDLEAGFQNILDGNIASFPKALWYMSRFLNYMPEETGKWALAPCPVFEEGQPRSVGIGGTGTVVTQQSKNAELAADFITYAKCSEEGCRGIWENLGFDVCNTDLWTDETITKDTSNQYIKFFVTNPFDVLNEIKDEIGKISVVKISPTINEQMCTITLNDILENGKPVADALKEAQDAVDLEQ